MTKCPNCGTMNETGSRFCFQCGQSLAADGGSGSSTQPLPPPGFPPLPTSFPGMPTGQDGGPQPPTPVSGFPPSAGYPSTDYPREPSYGGYPPPGFPPGTPPGYMMPPEPERRRRWLWIVLGIVFGCILVCVAVGIWGATSGETWINDASTWVAEESTEQAGP